MIDLFKFLEIICQEPNQVSSTFTNALQSLYAHVAGLLGDLVDCQGRTIMGNVNQAWISRVLQALKESRNEENRETAGWAWSKIQ